MTKTWMKANITFNLTDVVMGNSKQLHPVSLKRMLFQKLLWLQISQFLYNCSFYATFSHVYKSDVSETGLSSLKYILFHVTSYPWQKWAMWLQVTARSMAIRFICGTRQYLRLCSWVQRKWVIVWLWISKSNYNSGNSTEVLFWVSVSLGVVSPGGHEE